jgi:isoquinoline 1-oxidoreductase beta subunit
MSRGMRLSRRALLAGGGLAVGFIALGVGSCALVPPIPRRPAPTLADATGWIQLTPEGRFVLWSPRAEMGQDVLGALRHIAALELGVPDAAVALRIAGTADIAHAKATVGSDSVRELWLPLAQACATLREAVLAHAAAALGDHGLRLEAGSVRAVDGRRVALKALAAPPLRLDAVERPPQALRAWAALRQGPADAARAVAPQLHALVTGAPLYAADVRLPGMLHAAVLRAPWRRELGPRLDGWNEAAVRAVPGFVAQLRLPELDGPVLVARHPQALLAMRAAAAVRWIAPAHTPDAAAMVDVDRALARGRFTQDEGEVQDGAWTVDLRLDVPLAAHAAIEPRCAVARFDAAGGLELWCATQDPFYIRDVMARDHGLALERIVVHNRRIGGGFGGRTVANVEREAAFVARAVEAPVKLQWTREDEFLGSFHRAPSSHRVKVRVGADGLICDWWHALSSSHVIFTSAAMPAWMQAVTDVVGDPGTARGQHAPYAFVRQRRSLQLTRVPLATGPWRGLGAGPNVLAIEAAMDAAARASGEDPVAFRLKHLAQAPAGDHLASPQRLAAVLQRVATRAAGLALAPASPGERLGRGVACGVYKGRSVAAAVAEVRVSAERIRVTRLWCSHDCGAMVDARGVRAQVEGNLVWSLALVLSDELTAPQATPGQTRFAAYALPRITDMPALDIDLVPSTEEPSGAGETAIVAGAGAIYNAIAAATGVMPARLPVRLPAP